MRRELLHGCLWTALIGCLAGCERAMVRSNHPPDPILASKASVDGKPESARPLVVHHEPTMPRVPATALASAPKQRSSALRTMVRNAPSAAESTVASQDLTPSVPVLDLQTPSPRETTVQAIPAVRTHEVETPKLEATPVSVRKEVVGDHGHADDYSWLQGVLDRHYQGHLHLRFCEAAEDDDWGGKVCLEADARLEAYQSGDVIHVEGEVLRENGKVLYGRWNQYPRYRITAVRLVRPR